MTKGEGKRIMTSVGSGLFWGTCDVWFSSIQSSDGFELVFVGVAAERCQTRMYCLE